MNDTLKSAGDFELWTRFYKHADLYAVDEPIGIFRTHEGQVSVAFAETREKRIALQRTGGRPMNRIEAMLRNTVLKKRPLSLSKYLPFLGYSSNIVKWNKDKQTGAIHKNYFV